MEVVLSQTQAAEVKRPQSSDEEQWSVRIGASSPEDRGQLLNEFRPYLLAIASAELPDVLSGKMGASDIVQDAILKGFENFPQFRGSTREELSGWLRTILLRLMANARKGYLAQKRDMDLEVLADSRLAHPQQESPSKVISGREEQVVLEHAMSLLSEDSRQAITLRHRDNLSFAEIGIRLGKSEDAARKTWARAVEQLKQVLNRD